LRDAEGDEQPMGLKVGLYLGAMVLWYLGIAKPPQRHKTKTPKHQNTKTPKHQNTYSIQNKMAKSKLPNGVYTANLTPLKPNGKIDFQLLVAHCKWLLKNGSTGLALLGTTGEATSFSLNERKRILKETIAGGIPAKKIMVGTGCCSLPETVALTKHALSLGVGSILLLPPYYYKQVTQEGIFQYVDSLIQQVQHPSLRIYLYHFPKMSGLAFSIPLIQQLKEKHPKTIVQVFAGTEKYLLDIIKIGGAGCISATANVTCPMAGEVYKLWKKKKPAKKKNNYMVKVRTSFEGFPFSGALKTYMSHVTDNPKWQTVRLPNEPLSDKAFKKLLGRLDKLKFVPKNTL